MTWKAIIITFIASALFAFGREHPLTLGASIAGFAVLLWIGYKLDKAAAS